MSYIEEDLLGGETGEQQPVDDGRIEVGGRRFTPEELAEALRYKEQDYPNLQRRLSQSQEELRQREGRLAELEDLVSNLRTEQEPYGQPVEPYYGQPLPGQGQPAYAQADVVRAIASQVERTLAPRLSAVERVSKELQGLKQDQEQMRYAQERLVQIESEYSSLRDNYSLDQKTLNAVAAEAVAYQQRTGGYLDAEHAYRSHMFNEAMKEEKTAAERKRKRASAAEPGSAEQVNLPSKVPQTDAEWQRFALSQVGEMLEGEL